MRVGFGITNLLRGQAGSGIDGIGTYTSELYRALLNEPDLDLYPFSAGSCDYQADKFDTVAQSQVLPLELALASINPWYSYERRIQGKKLDLIHATDNVIPVVKKIPLISTIMDVIPLTHPEWLKTSTMATVKQAAWKQVAKRSAHIITISEYSKRTISETLHFDPERISVVPLGVNRVFFDRLSQGKVDEILNKYGLSSKRYFLNIGTLQPRKNIGRLLAAMEILPQDVKMNFPLVIVGKYGWGSEDLLPAIERAQEQGWCKWLKRLPDVELRALLQSATAMVFPSLCEGFGLPVIEAFASQTPVITSNSSSLAEVSAGHAWLIDPMSIDSIGQMMLKIAIEQDMEVHEKIDTGYFLAKSLSWSECARKSHDVYRLVLNQ